MAESLFHPEARAEYESAIAWYRSRSERAADDFEAEVQRFIEQIESNPEIYSEYDENHRYAILRRYPYSPVYRVATDRILIVAVAHSARQPGYWQDRS